MKHPRRRIALSILAVLVAGGAWFAARKIPSLVIGTRELTLLPSEAGQLRLIVVGDTGFGSEAQKQVAADMETVCARAGLDALVFLGDNFYRNGVQSTEDPLWQERFEGIYSTPCLAGKPVYAALGNHDYRGNAEAQIAYTGTPGGRWKMPARFFRVGTGGIAELVFIDSNFPDVCWMQGCSMDWAETVLKNSAARWKLVFGHHPVLSGGGHGLPVWPVQWALSRMLCNGRADIYLSGHDHGMQHLAGRPASASCRLEQVVSGGGGAPLGSLEQTPDSRFVLASHGFVFANLSPERARFEFFALGAPDTPAYVFAQSKPRPVQGSPGIHASPAVTAAP